MMTDLDDLTDDAVLPRAAQGSVSEVLDTICAWMLGT